MLVTATAGRPPPHRQPAPQPQRPAPPCPALTCFWGLVQDSRNTPGSQVRGLRGFACRLRVSQATGQPPCALSDLAPALHSLPAADGRPSLWSRLPACLPFLLGCLPGQGNQVLVMT